MDSKPHIEWCITCKRPQRFVMIKGLWTCTVCKPPKAEKEKAKRKRALFPNTKITADMAADILEQRLAGVRTEDLAKKYDVSVQTIQDHTRGFTATRTMIFKWIDERIAFHMNKEKTK